MKRLLTVLCLCATSAFAGDTLNEAVSSAPILVRGGIGTVHLTGWPALVNLGASPVYLHFYDKATTAEVTVGTTPQVFMIPVPQGGWLSEPRNGQFQRDFTYGIVIAATTSPLFSGSTAPDVALFTVLQWQ